MAMSGFDSCILTEHSYPATLRKQSKIFEREAPQEAYVNSSTN
jgi:hypothetical protein